MMKKPMFVLLESSKQVAYCRGAFVKYISSEATFSKAALIASKTDFATLKGLGIKSFLENSFLERCFFVSFIRIIKNKSI